MKSIFRIFILSILFLGIIPIGCYRCPEPVGYIVEATSLSIQFQNKRVSENSDTFHIQSSTPNELYFRVYIQGNQKYVTENESPSLLLGQTVSATKKCIFEYFIAHKPALKSLDISCNKDLFSHLANSSLNDEITLLVAGYTTAKNDTFSMEQFNDSLLSDESFIWNSFYSQRNIRFFFNENVPKGIYQFKFEMKLEDGASIEGMSPWISID